MWRGHGARWLQSATVCVVFALLAPGKLNADDFNLGTCEQARGTYQGVLDAGDPTFGRPTSSDVFPPFGTETPSCFGSNVYEYDSYTFFVGEAGLLRVKAETVAGGDTFLALYYSDSDETPFPGPGTTGAAACVNLAAANDDGGEGLLSRIELPITLRGGWYTVVVTSFSSAPSGAYTLDIVCDPESTAAPSLGTRSLLATLLLLFAAGMFLLRRRPRNATIP